MVPFPLDNWQHHLSLRIDELDSYFDGTVRLSEQQQDALLRLEQFESRWDTVEWDWDRDYHLYVSDDYKEAARAKVAPGRHLGWTDDKVDAARKASVVCADLRQLARQHVEWWQLERATNTVFPLLEAVATGAVTETEATALDTVVPRDLWSSRSPKKLAAALSKSGVVEPAASTRIRPGSPDRYYPRPAVQSRTVPKNTPLMEIQVTFSAPRYAIEPAMSTVLHNPRIWLKETGFGAWSAKLLPDSRAKHRFTWNINGGYGRAVPYSTWGYESREREAELERWRRRADIILMTHFSDIEWSVFLQMDGAIRRGENAIDISFGGPTQTLTMQVPAVPDALPRPKEYFAAKLDDMRLWWLWRRDDGKTGSLMLHTYDADSITDEVAPHERWYSCTEERRGRDDRHIDAADFARWAARDALRSELVDDIVSRFSYEYVLALLSIPSKRSSVTARTR